MSFIIEKSPDMLKFILWHGDNVWVRLTDTAVYNTEYTFNSYNKTLFLWNRKWYVMIIKCVIGTV